MTEKVIAQALIPLVGGRENILSVMHCATRLRIVVSDKDKIQVKEVENLDKVKGSFFNAGQYQIIFGTGLVNRVYEAVMNELGLQPEAAVDDKPAKPVTGNRFQRAIRMFSDVFVPIIPVLVATGLFMGLRGLLTQEAVLGVFGMTPDDIPQQLLLFTQILTDTAFAFLPALVCWSTFKNFGGSPVIGIVLGLMLVSSRIIRTMGPSVTTAAREYPRTTAKTPLPRNTFFSPKPMPAMFAPPPRPDCGRLPGTGPGKPPESPCPDKSGPPGGIRFPPGCAAVPGCG